MRAVVIGAGLGGLGAALRLQGMGHDVVVLEQRERPGGRAYRLRDAGYTWDTGPSLITMPWVLEETFAAGGLDLHREVDLVRLDPFYRIFWDGEAEHLDFVAAPERMKAQIARFSARDAAAFDGFMATLRPIYEDGILDAGRRAFLRPGDLVRFLPRMLRLGAALPLHRLVARHFEHPRIREAFSFHSLFIGGDPFRVPAIYAALVYLQFLDEVWYARGGVYSVVEAMARPLDVRCGARAERIEHAGGRVRGVALEGGERLAADVVVSNADVLAAHELLGARAPARRLRPTMSCFLLYLGTDRRLERLEHHTLLVGKGYRRFIADVTRRGRIAPTFSTYLHVPSRTEPGMAAPGGDSIAALLPVPNLRAGNVDWTRAADGLRDALVADMESAFGLRGLGDSVVVEHRMTPLDFRDELGAVDGNAFAVEPTLHQSAWFRMPNRDRRVAGLYHVGGGTHPGAGVPGVLLGAEVTAGLVAHDHPRPAGATTGRRRAAAAA
ncbi:MAG TPA: phytoene desaturase family protein [Solirubrobacteraceae bacterium]|nr:phytoene desaturase family protein [Solirubrobacteraceae bacterium]